MQELAKKKKVYGIGIKYENASAKTTEVNHFLELDSKSRSDLTQLESIVASLNDELLTALPDVADMMSGLNDCQSVEDLKNKIDYATLYVTGPISKFKSAEKKVANFFASNPYFSRNIQSEIKQNILHCYSARSFSEFLDFAEPVNSVATFLDDFTTLRITIAKNRPNFSDAENEEIKSIGNTLKNPETSFADAKAALLKLNSIVVSSEERKGSVQINKDKELVGVKISQLKDRIRSLFYSTDTSNSVKLQSLNSKLSLLEEAFNTENNALVVNNQLQSRIDYIDQAVVKIEQSLRSAKIEISQSQKEKLAQSIRASLDKEMVKYSDSDKNIISDFLDIIDRIIADKQTTLEDFIVSMDTGDIRKVIVQAQRTKKISSHTAVSIITALSLAKIA
jgi:hypothetical protein